MREFTVLRKVVAKLLIFCVPYFSFPKKFPVPLNFQNQATLVTNRNAESRASETKFSPRCIFFYIYLSYW